VDLYGTVEGEALLSEYDGEARLIQQPDVAEIVSHELIFLCESGELARRVVQATRPPAVLIDVSGGLARGRPGCRLVDARINPGDARGHEGLLEVPHPLASLLADVLRDLDRQLGVEEALAVVLQPASAFGEPGVEELRDQTIRLLNFTPVPTEVFGRQLAFNVLAGSDPGHDTEQRVADEVAHLLGWPARRLAIRLVTVPVFHGHCVQLRFRLRTGTELAAIRNAVGGIEGHAPADDGERFCGPLELAGETAVRLSGLSADGLGGYWLWIVAGEATAAGADRAVELAQQVGAL